MRFPSGPPRPFRPILTALLGAGALALPVLNQAAAATVVATKTTTRKLVGQTEQASRWGTVQTVVTVKLTTKPGSKHVARRYSDLGGSYSYHTSRSQYIMSQALPLLRQEFLQTQSANIQMVSGATDTSEAFVQSLQSALLKASA